MKIIMVGGGGHAKVLIELIGLAAEYEIAGILDRLEAGSLVSSISVLGNDDMLADIFAAKITHACIGVGSVKDTRIRRSLFEKVKKLGFVVPSLIHPDAVISNSAKLSEGAQIMAKAVIQAGSIIGENTIINTGAIIEHDGVIGRHVHVCPGVVIAGVCKIGDDSLIGVGATVINGISIGKNVTVGAGALVVNDIPDGVAVKGVPAR